LLEIALAKLDALKARGPLPDDACEARRRHPSARQMERVVEIALLAEADDAVDAGAHEEIQVLGPPPGVESVAHGIEIAGQVGLKRGPLPGVVVDQAPGVVARQGPE